MNPKSLACDPDLLQRSLDENLSDEEEDRLSAHLTSCAVCRESLEELAARARQWQQIGEVLRSESSAMRRTHPKELRSAVDEATIWYEPDTMDRAFSADFAVDFLDPPQSPEALGRLGEIDILEVVGQGGMGIVLRGFQSALNRPVAVKVLAPHLATSGAARQRFAREAQAAAAIVHPNVMPIFMVDATGKLPYLVMPYIAGESLQARIDRQGGLPTVDILRIALQVARGLAAAHAQGLVHRDVKPANILLERGIDRVLLTDFGLARAADDASLTRTGFIAGTPQYMSPEQARGDSVDARSDLFSLGSVMYTMCTGRPPFRADSSYGILRRITDNEPRPIRELQPGVPSWLAQLVDRLLAKRAADRYPSGEIVATILEQCLAHVQQPAHTAIPVELQSFAVRRVPRDLPALLGTALLIVATIVLGARFSVWQRRPSLPHRSENQASVREANPTVAVEIETQSVDRTPAPKARTTNTLPVEDVSSELIRLRQQIESLQRRVDNFWE